MKAITHQQWQALKKHGYTTRINGERYILTNVHPQKVPGKPLLLRVEVKDGFYFGGSVTFPNPDPQDRR